MKKCYFLQFCTSPQKNLYNSFDRDENFHTYVKSKIKLGKCRELFFIFFIENELFDENLKIGVRGKELNGRNVQLTQLILIPVKV